MNNYQREKASAKFGGYRVVFTGIQKNLSSGRYTIDLDRLPELKLGYIPAGTPIAMNDVTRKVDIHYAFRVHEAVTGTTATSVKVSKGSEGSRIMVGMKLMVAPTTIDGTGTGIEVTAVDRTNTDYDTITISTGGFGVALLLGDTLIEADKKGADAEIKVLPNAIQPYDLAKKPDADLVWTDGMYNLIDGVILENRIPPVVDAVKEYMLKQGVYVHYSKSAE